VQTLLSRQQKYNAIGLAASLVMVAAIATYGQFQSILLGTDVVGQTLVNSEFPSPHDSPIYLKPATWLMIVIIISWFFFIEMVKYRVRKERGFGRSIITLGFILAIILSAYEVAYNFMIWGVLMTSTDANTINPDVIVNSFPFDTYNVNLVFATKSFVTILGCGLYGFFVLREDRGDRN